jgi:lipoate-protein ligase A
MGEIMVGLAGGGELMECIILPFLQADAAQQMELDAELFRVFASDCASPVIRFYSIDPPALTIGFHQREESVLEIIGDCSIDLVRRPTGGRAVLHAGDLTYSVIGQTAGPLFGERTLDIYLTISRGVKRGIENLGIEVGLVESSNVEPSPLCFRLASKYELVCKGEKLSGGALLKRNGRFLFQGSILLDFPPPDYAELSGSRASVNEFLGERMTVGAFIESITAGFRKEFGVEMKHGTWPDCLDRRRFLFYNTSGANS